MVTVAIAEKMDLSASSPEVQELIKEHHAWIENFYTCPPEMYKGLGKLYIENPEFTAFYEKVKPGIILIDLIGKGIYRCQVRKVQGKYTDVCMGEVLPDSVHGGTALVLVSAGQDNYGVFGCQSPSGFKSDAGVGACYDNGSAGLVGDVSAVPVRLCHDLSFIWSIRFHAWALPTMGIPGC